MKNYCALFLVLLIGNTAIAQQANRYHGEYCQQSDDFYWGKAYLNDRGEVILKNFTYKTKCVRESGQYQYQFGTSLCPMDMIMETQGWHDKDGFIKGELRYRCLNNSEWNSVLSSN